MVSVMLGPEMMKEEEIESQMFERDNESVGKQGSITNNKKYHSFSRVY